ncbi:hypothetical protein GW17_00010006 [Ensete ventricosum]|nr:hypothetical protein GW17_00010006 [Ensete ventricosum]
MWVRVSALRTKVRTKRKDHDLTSLMLELVEVGALKPRATYEGRESKCESVESPTSCTVSRGGFCYLWPWVNGVIVAKDV